MNRKKQKEIARSVLGENLRVRYINKSIGKILGMDRLIFRESLDSASIGYFLERDGRQIPLKSIRRAEYFELGDYYFLDLKVNKTQEETLNRIMGEIKWV